MKELTPMTLSALLLLASGAGSEGLDLKGTRLMQLLEPHWNESRLDQVIGRGIRYRSHEGLPPEDRNGKVTPVRGNISTEPSTFSVVWKTKRVAVEHAAML